MAIRLRFAPVLCLIALVAAAGCEFKRGSNFTAPSPTEHTSASLVGVWTSLIDGPGASAFSGTSATVPELRGCIDVRWEVPSQVGAVAQGPFKVVCEGPIVLTGTARGELTSATTVLVSVTGSATVPNLGECAFSLGGTGTLDGDTLRIPYTGTTCVGPVSGDEILRRNQQEPTAPEPPPPTAPEPPAPTPPTPAPPAPGNPCASTSGPFIVECIEDRYPERRQAGVSHAQRVDDMIFLRDRIIEAGRCGGLDLAWNLKRGIGPHSIDAIAWRHPNGFVDVVDIGAAYDDTSQPLNLQWVIVAGPPGYDGFSGGGC
jgi:hypothetical protein